jgi:hypothetical protein
MRGVILGLCAVLLFPLAAGKALSQTELDYEVRARANLLFGTGVTSGSAYYDVPITQVPTAGVLIKLPYTTKGGKLTFDLHHRVGASDDLGYPAEVMTVVDVITGGANHLGTYTMLDVIEASSESSEPIERATRTEIDSFVSPMSRKTIEIETEPGPQSISIVGRELSVTRGGVTTRIDTPGTRIAMISNIRFEEAQLGETLEFDDLD